MNLREFLQANRNEPLRDRPTVLLYTKAACFRGRVIDLNDTARVVTLESEAGACHLYHSAVLAWAIEPAKAPAPKTVSAQHISQLDPKEIT